MSASALVALLQNAVLLTGMVILFEFALIRRWRPDDRLRQVIAGVIVGVLALGLILSSFKLRPGIVFDTRSVLLGVSGLLLGPLPTAVAAGFAVAFRFAQGGTAAGVGVAVIVASGAVGVIWRHVRSGRLQTLTFGELYAMGLVIHVIMLALMLTLGSDDARVVLGTVGLPVMVIHPLATAVLARLLIQRIRHQDAAATLQESAALLRIGGSMARFGGWSANLTEQRVLWSDEVALIHGKPSGYSPSVEEGIAFYAPEWRPRISELFAACARDGTPYDEELEIINATGQRIWVRSKAEAVRDETGRVVRIHGAFQDISERKRHEADLRQALAEAEIVRAQLTATVQELERTTRVLRASEAEYRALFQTSPHCMWVHDRKTQRFLAVNDTAVARYGYSREDFLGMTTADVEASPSESPVVGVLRHRDRQGNLMLVEIASRDLLWEGREARLVLANDVSERELAHQAIEDSERRFRRAITGAPFPIMLHAEGGEVLQLSQSWCEITGYSAAEIRTTIDWVRRAFGERQAEVLAGIKALCRLEQRRHEGDFVIQTRSGERRIWEFSSAPLGRLPDGRRLIMSMAADVTERRAVEASEHRARTRLEVSRQALLSVIEDQKLAEAALRASEERYRSLVETSFDWVWEIDPQGRYTYSSPRVRELLGFTPEEILARSLFDLMPGNESPPARVAFEALAAGRRPFAAVEKVCRHRDGRLVILESSGVPVTGPDGTWLGYRGIDRDITGRRTAEKALRLRGAALEAAANAIVITDSSGVIEWANPAFAELSGWSLAEAVGRNPRDLLKSDQHPPEFYQALWKTILAGNVWRGEIVNRRKDGALRTEDMTVAPVRNEAGEITHFIAVKQDITRQKAIEAGIIQSQRIQAIGTLASGIAHDLNNILAPILLVTDVIKERIPDPSDRELLALTQASASRGAEIVRQLLTFSRGQGGTRSVLQPRHILKDTVGIIRETFPREIEVSLHASADLWTVEADPTQLHQVFLNLCVNARDAMPDGGRLDVFAGNVTLAAGDPALPHEAAPGRYVEFEVQDTGHGIPPEIRPQIFDPFFTTKPLGKGTGLGLSTVLGIVRGHGGFVKVNSCPGKGTSFRVFLPGVSEATVAPAEVGPADAAPRGTRPTVLVVDDESPIRLVTKAVFERAGYPVLTAINGEDALKQYRASRAAVRVVVTDLMMPVMNGLVLIRSLREITPDLAIIATSGVTEENRRSELKALGVTELVIKPAPAADLLAAVHRCCSESPGVTTAARSGGASGR